MSRIGIDYLCSGTYTSLDSYDSNKWNLGSLIKQDASGFIGPQKISVAYPLVDNPTFTPVSIDGFSWSSSIDWIFGAFVTGRTFVVTMYIYNRDVPSYTYNNYLIIVGSSGTGNFTLRGFRALYYTYTGSATISLKGGTGRRVNSTGFTTRRIAAGSRIGFGSTDPTQITTWYTIDTINSNTQLDTVEVITIFEEIIFDGEPLYLDITFTQAHLYVIEELRFAFTVTHPTTTQGGLFLTKGVRYTDFSASPVTISSNTASTDNLRSTYWLVDAVTVSNTAASGLAVDGNRKTEHDGSTHSAYVIDTTSSRAYYYNLCASDAITVNTGRMTLTQSNVQVTAAQTITNLVQSYNGIVETTRHGTGLNDKSLYFLTSTRLVRSSVSEITNNRTNWHKDMIPEIPSGTTNTTAATSLLNNLDYDSISDRFIIFTSGTGGIRSYVTKFLNSANRFENIFMFVSGTVDGASATSSYIPLPFNSGAGTIYSNTIKGISHVLRISGSSTSTLYAIPIGAHWEYTKESNQCAISPVIPVPNNKNLLKMVLNSIENLGSDPYVTPLNDIRTYFRLDGFEDNSGLWFNLGFDGDLSGLSNCRKIQFKFEFQMLGNCWGIPGRLLGFTLIYDDIDIQQNHQPSVVFSTDKTFAWRFSATYSATLPDLRVRLYNAETNEVLVDDNTSNPIGSFQKTTDGSTWGSWDNLDKTNETTYIRYTPLSLYDGVKIRATLTTL
jgi:hypothetical protein